MAINAKKRLRVYTRDGFRCKSCGSNTNLTIDHILPISQGGVDDIENLRTLCYKCNTTRGNFNPTWLDRMTWWVMTKRKAHKMREDLRTEMSSKDGLLKREILQEVETRISGLKPTISEFLQKIKGEANLPLVGLENTVTAYNSRGQERDEKLLTLIYRLADKVEELETIINK